MRVISDTKKPIKIWASILEQEAENQVRNLSTLPFVFKHVAVMADAHHGKGSTVGTVIATKGAIIPSALGVDLGCFTGETKIPLVDGSCKTLEELVGLGDFWVYSINKDNIIVPGKARAIKTRSNADLLEVKISGGEKIICTPDHKFLMRDGKYVEAKFLKKEDSLMPFYRSYEKKDGYEILYNPDGRAAQTHKHFYRLFNGNVPKGYVIHHDNHSKLDNRPENLILMTPSDHSRHHNSEIGKKRFRDEEFKRKRKAFLDKHGYYAPEKLQSKIDTGIKNIKKYMNESPDHFKESVAGNGLRGKKYLQNYNTSEKGRAKSREIGARFYPCDICGVKIKSTIGLYSHKKKEHNNHKVISVKKLNYKSDVYCLNVDKYHNFALSAGVFVHNCGVISFNTKLNINDLGGDKGLRDLRHSLERSIPVGMNSHKEVSDYAGKSFSELGNPREDLNKDLTKAAYQVGTLGGGNHFIEICYDEHGDIWLMIHSGSRNIGKRLAEVHIDKAKDIMKRYFIDLPDPDLAYLVQGTKEFKDYIDDALWAQRYAKANRNCMVRLALKDISHHVYKDNRMSEMEFFKVDCHHNYTAMENHFGENIWVTRKGAVSAKSGEYALIPGSMGARSFVVKGLGNPESFNSCSHGAGRMMSRTKARAMFSKDDLEKQTQGVECRKDVDVIDEIPSAYKPIDVVMKDQEDLVEIYATLKQVLCIKG